jgi:hydrogenase expression/formation protein HypE
VHGTVNDIAVAGGCPRWLSLAMVIEEGLPLDVLGRVLDAVSSAAARCGVRIATGDTKVVPVGECDGLYLNTAGIGERWPEFALSPARIAAGDAVLVNGPVGDHGMAVLSAREGIAISNGPVTDSAPVHRLVEAVRPYGAAVRFMRDPTRGGVAAVLNEIVNDRAVGICLDETGVPVSPGARAVAEMLGLDILNVASEGRLVLICAPEAAQPILDAWRRLPEGAGATRMGTATDDAGRVVLKTVTGGRRLVDVPQGELLPRIC